MFKNHSKSDSIKNEMPGCQASLSNGGKCGEVKTLEILKEFQQLYESKINEIKDECSCTSTRIKIQMLEDWVKDLTEQNTMLVQVVEELEQEASERVSLLEEKLRHSSNTSFEIMKQLQDYDAQNLSNQNDVLQRLMCFQSDVNNLTEFIRRIREEGSWSIEGLHFYSVTKEDLCEIIPTSAKNLSKQQELEESLDALKYELLKAKAKQDEYERETKQKEILIHEQTKQIEKLNEVVERCANNMPDRQKLLEELHELRLHLKLKTEDFNRLEMEQIRNILYTNEVLEGDINYMKDEMGHLSTELKVLQELLKISSSSPFVEEHNLSLSKSLNLLQEHSDTLVDQLKLTQNQITREIKLNDINSVKISELQRLLDTKVEELQETKSKLECSIYQTKEYENKIKEMEQQITKFQKLQNMNDQKTDEIVITCNSDLICLKQKIEILNKILNEKSNEILRLHAELSVKSDTINDLLKENEITVKDNKKLTQNALNLDEQLETYKLQCAELSGKYNNCLAELENVNKWENKVHEEYKQEKKILLEKIEASKAEEMNLNARLQKATDELAKTKTSMKQKDEEMKNFAFAKEEIISLKQEINKLTKIRSRLLSDNQKLQEQISGLNINTTKFENRNIIISQQLDKCLEELNSLQCSKDKLEERNIQLEAEVGHLQRAFNELNQEVRYKNESVMSLEHELLETKCSRDEICAESRIVVSNVRSWLEEQKHINVALNESIKEKNLIIEELSMEKNLLLKNIKDVCERYETLTEELHLCQQYVSDMSEYPIHIKKTPMKKSINQWGSQNSVGESPINSPVFLEDQNSDYSNEENDGEPNPAKWMRKVQHMSEDLLKSKKYWQTKLAKSSKKIKPVKDTKLNSVKST